MKNKISYLTSQHKIILVFLLFFAFLSVHSILVNRYLFQEYCTGSIVLFEGHHCGADTRTLNDLVRMNTHEIYLEPAVIAAAYIYPKTNVYNDWRLSFREYGDRFTPQYVLFDIYVYQRQSDFVGRFLLPVFIWLLNIPYWFLLAWLFAKLWKHKYVGRPLIFAFYLICLRYWLAFVVYFIIALTH